MAAQRLLQLLNKPLPFFCTSPAISGCSPKWRGLGAIELEAGAASFYARAPSAAAALSALALSAAARFAAALSAPSAAAAM